MIDVLLHEIMVICATKAHQYVSLKMHQIHD